MKEWLRLPPALRDVDLRPYFTYSRGQGFALDAVAAGQLTGTQRKLLGEVLARPTRYGATGSAICQPRTPATVTK